MTESIQDRLKNLNKGETKTVAPVKPAKLENLKKGEYGGKRTGSGRKTKEATLVAKGRKDLIEGHYDEKVKIKLTDPKTGKTIIISKPRLLVMLEKLYEVGFTTSNADAINKWLDRALGKPLQKVGGDPDEPVHIKVDVEGILAKAYPNGDDETED